MWHLNRKNSLALLTFIGCSGAANAALITDNYIGSDNHGYGDVIGTESTFGIDSLEFTRVGNTLNVSITTGFAGKGDNGLFSSSTLGGTGIGYGDLFLSTTWNPDGPAPYYSDDASTGTVWDYGFSLDDRFMAENLVGTGTLYSLNSNDNVANTLSSNYFMTGATFRDGQEIAVNTQSDVTALSTGAWGIGSGTVDFTIDLTGTSLLNSSNISFHWGPSCGNDIIEGIGAAAPSAVPVPATAWLFMSGLIGLVGIARRK